MIGIKQHLMGKQDSSKCEFDFDMSFGILFGGGGGGGGGGGVYAYELLNQSALKFSNCIFKVCFDLWVKLFVFPIHWRMPYDSK